DLVVFHFPLWWHTHPAMLKGWFDRVFVNGALYTSKMRYDRGYFAGKKAVCAVTIGAPEAAFTGNGRGGDLTSMMWPTHYSLYYMGFTVLPPFFAYGIQNSSGFTSMSDAELKQHLEDNKRAWGDYLVAHETHAPIVFPGWDDWDESGHQKSWLSILFLWESM
ncbi:MAG: NAD(P)H-dependent oxidoreductase, partial [Hyphomicrobiales bacterium]